MFTWVHPSPHFPIFPPASPYLNGVLLKDAQLQEDIQLDLPLVEQLFHLHLSVVQLLQDRLDMADRAGVGCFVVGYSRVPVAEQGKKRGRGLAVLKVMEEPGGSPHLGKGDANQVSLLTSYQSATVT